MAEQIPKGPKEGKITTYVCPTCGNVFYTPFRSTPIKCPAESCTVGLFTKMQLVVQKFEPQIRKVCKMTPDYDIDLEDIKRFCAEIFWNDIHLYQDRLALDATLDRLGYIGLVDIPYNFG